MSDNFTEKFGTWLAIDWSSLSNAPVAVAFSGGSDSTGLVIAVVEHLKSLERPTPILLTVDHCLRQASAEDASKCAAFAYAHGLVHHTLEWSAGHEEKNLGNIQARAREARYQLLRDWCSANKVPQILLGHTADDQAETLIMGLQRGSGVDGLSGIWPVRKMNGVRIVRPLLGVTRKNIRHELRQRGVDWIEDPSNLDTRFTRTHARQLLQSLQGNRVSPEATPFRSNHNLTQRLATTAQQMQIAKLALDSLADELLRRYATSTSIGVVAIDTSEWTNSALDTRLRALARILSAVGNHSYRPRYAALQNLESAIASGEKFTSTLHRCIISRAKISDSDHNREPLSNYQSNVDSTGTPIPATSLTISEAQKNTATKRSAIVICQENRNNTAKQHAPDQSATHIAIPLATTGMILLPSWYRPMPSLTPVSCANSCWPESKNIVTPMQVTSAKQKTKKSKQSSSTV